MFITVYDTNDIKTGRWAALPCTRGYGQVSRGAQVLLGLAGTLSTPDWRCETEMGGARHWGSISVAGVGVVPAA